MACECPRSGRPNCVQVSPGRGLWIVVGFSPAGVRPSNGVQYGLGLLVDESGEELLGVAENDRPGET
ncbi:hypothetical protein GCM10010219_40990 [Streptomyces netropsis]|nr:hypothetical protein GCM10010219_40990 [Streptomyces netropsis]